jgi:uncharacterized protein
MRCRVRLTLAIALLLVTSTSFATSFDCTRARTQVEKLICADLFLGRLDEALALNYGAMLTVDVGRSAQSLRAEQLGWLSRRNRCKDVQCLVQAYSLRIDETCEYGVASGVHPTCSLAENILSRQVQASASGPNVCPITPRELLGHWRRTSDSGFHEEMAFESEAGSRRFDSWLHARPEFLGGSWSLDNCAIHIGHPSLRRLDSTLDVLA